MTETRFPGNVTYVTFPPEQTAKERCAEEIPGIASNILEMVWTLAGRVDGGPLLAATLAAIATPELIADPQNWPHRLWERVGCFFLKLGRYFDAIAVFDALYRHMLRYQNENGKWLHKGMPLCWI